MTILNYCDDLLDNCSRFDLVRGNFNFFASAISSLGFSVPFGSIGLSPVLNYFVSYGSDGDVTRASDVGPGFPGIDLPC